jgi:hypothetical protein
MPTLVALKSNGATSIHANDLFKPTREVDFFGFEFSNYWQE